MRSCSIRVSHLLHHVRSDELPAGKGANCLVAPLGRPLPQQLAVPRVLGLVLKPHTRFTAPFYAGN